MRRWWLGLTVLVGLVIGGAVVMASAQGEGDDASPAPPETAVARAVGWQFEAVLHRESPRVFRVTVSGDRLDGHKRVGFFRAQLRGIPRPRYAFAPLPRQSDRGQLGPGHPTRDELFRYQGDEPPKDLDRLVFEAKAGAMPFPTVSFAFPAG